MKKILSLIFCILSSSSTSGCSPGAETSTQSEVKYFAFYIDNKSVRVDGVQKSVDEFIAEIKLQQSSGASIQLNVAGNSNQEKEVTDLASRLKAELNIKRVGMILESK